MAKGKTEKKKAAHFSGVKLQALIILSLNNDPFAPPLRMVSHFLLPVLKTQKYLGYAAGEALQYWWPLHWDLFPNVWLYQKS